MSTTLVWLNSAMNCTYPPHELSENPKGLTDSDIPNDITLSSSASLSVPSAVVSGGISVGGQLTLTGTGTSTIAGDVAFDTNTLYIDSINNRVGIGTTSPGSALSVVGNTLITGTSTIYGGIQTSFIVATSTATSTFTGGISAAGLASLNNGIVISGGTLLNLSTATSTFNAGINIVNGGCFSIQGVCAVSASTGIVNSGTQNRLAYYSTAALVDSINFLVIDPTNSRLGIGTTTPGTPLSVTGEAVITGTTTPAHKLQVSGDIAATGFINVSTAASKKDINYLTNNEESSLLMALKETKVARYHYLGESSDAPTRFGLIAEEAPKEVLSGDGKGVDIYKMVTFTFAGLKSELAEIEKLKIRMADIEAKISSSTPSSLAGTGLSQGLIPALTDYLASLGVRIVEGIAYFKDLVADKVTTKKLCIDDVCVTKDELKSLLDVAGVKKVQVSEASVVTPASVIPENEASSTPVTASTTSTVSVVPTPEIIASPTPITETTATSTETLP